jgi:hypothetical protein
MKSLLIAGAVAFSLSGAALLTPAYAIDDPILLEDDSMPTCSSGTSRPCNTKTTDNCIEYHLVDVNGKASPTGAGVGMQKMCKTKEIVTTFQYYSH